MGILQATGRGIFMSISGSKVIWWHGSYSFYLIFLNFPLIIRGLLLMHLLVCKDSLFAMLHVLNPTGILLRRRMMQAKKGEYIMLSLD